MWPVILVPVGVLAFTVYLTLAWHAGTSWISAEKDWGHHTATPIVGLIQGLKAGWLGLLDLVRHPGGPYANSPDATNLVNSVALIAGLVVLVEAVRTLPAAYSVYSGLSLIVPLASPLAQYPLNSFPRYEMVTFPLFICVAGFLVRKRWTAVGVGSGAVLLGMFAATSAAGVWIA